MRILAVADIHGKKENLEKIINAISQHNPDLLVIAGDIFNFHIPRAAAELLSSIKVPILGIRGNSDPSWLESKIRSFTPVRLLSSSPLTFQGISFMGLSGTVPLPFASKIQFFENRILKTAEQLINNHSILVVHPPPRGVRDQVGGRISAGSAGIRRLLLNKKPMAVICGHIHEQSGIGQLASVPVINCAMNKFYGGAIIECDNNSIKSIEMIKL